MKQYFYIKQVLDRIFSMLALIVLTPLFIVLGVVIKLDSKGPVFFMQRRIGQNNDEFNILKFRTMKIDAPKNIPTHLLHNPEQYITKLGTFLRRSSLDELPQLINIFLGQMSFVGPRPALWNQYDLIKVRNEHGVSSVYPGLTGWAQINGRDELPIVEKAKLDGEYIKKMSFLFDLKIIVKTAIRVPTSNGVVEGTKSKKDKIGV